MTRTYRTTNPQKIKRLFEVSGLQWSDVDVNKDIWKEYKRLLRVKKELDALEAAEAIVIRELQAANLDVVTKKALTIEEQQINSMNWDQYCEWKAAKNEGWIIHDSWNAYGKMLIRKKPKAEI